MGVVRRALRTRGGAMSSPSATGEKLQRHAFDTRQEIAVCTELPTVHGMASKHITCRVMAGAQDKTGLSAAALACNMHGPGSCRASPAGCVP